LDQLLWLLTVEITFYRTVGQICAEIMPVSPSAFPDFSTKSPFGS